MKALLGGLLLAIGILIAGASGLCTIMVIVASLPISMAQLQDGILIVLAFGGLPFAIGLTLVFGGLRLLRSARRAGAAATDGPVEGSGE